MAARGNKAKKKAKKRRHAETRKVASIMSASLNQSPARRSSEGQFRNN